MKTLKNFKTVDERTLDIFMEIGNETKRFGIVLLDDDTGNIVDNVIRIEQRPADNNLDLLKHWLRTGRRSWAELTFALRSCNLNALAEDIDESIRADK